MMAVLEPQPLWMAYYNDLDLWNYRIVIHLSILNGLVEQENWFMIGIHYRSLYVP